MNGSYFKALAESVSLCAERTLELPFRFDFTLSPWWRVFEVFSGWRHLSGVFDRQDTALQVCSCFIQMLAFNIQNFICLLKDYQMKFVHQ